MKSNLGDIFLVVNDTAHDLKIVTNILPELSNKVTDIHNKVPIMAENLERLLKLAVGNFLVLNVRWY